MRIELNIDPRAASRPRITTRGVYFTGPYKRFRQMARPLLEDALPDDFEPIDEPVVAVIEYHVPRPKSTTLPFPKPDIDNFDKALLDLLQPRVLTDDWLVAATLSLKQWTDSTPRIVVNLLSYSTSLARLAEAKTTLVGTQTDMVIVTDAASTNRPVKKRRKSKPRRRKGS